MPTLAVALDARKAKVAAAQFAAAGGQIRRSAGAIKKAVTGVFAGIGAAAVVRSLVKVNAQFETTMSTLRAVTGATGAAFDALEKRARQLGAATRYSATEAGDALIFLSRAGFTVNDSLAAVGSTLDLARAGTLDLGRSADIASNVLSQFGLNAAEMTRVADTLVTTANSANTNVAQLAEALKMAGPVAGALGISIEETSAAIGVLGDRGIQASLAGTNLRGIFAALLGPTSMATNALQRMGLSLDQVNPEKHDLIEIFGHFRRAGLSAADAVDIFGRRNAAAALILTQSVGRIKELTRANEEAGGAAEEAAKIMSDNLAGAFKNLASAIQEAFLQVGEGGLTGALRSMIDTATGASRILLGIADDATKADHAANTLAKTIKFMATAATIFVGAKLAYAISSAAVALVSFNAAASANPFGLIATMVSLAGAAIVTFAEKTDYARRKIESIKHQLADISATADMAAMGWAQYQRGLDIKAIDEQEKGLRRVQDAFKEISITLYKMRNEGKKAVLATDFQKMFNIKPDSMKFVAEDVYESLFKAIEKYPKAAGFALQRQQFFVPITSRKGEQINSWIQEYQEGLLSLSQLETKFYRLTKLHAVPLDMALTRSGETIKDLTDKMARYAKVQSDSIKAGKVGYLELQSTVDKTADAIEKTTVAQKKYTGAIGPFMNVFGPKVPPGWTPPSQPGNVPGATSQRWALENAASYIERMRAELGRQGGYALMSGTGARRAETIDNIIAAQQVLDPAKVEATRKEFEALFDTLEKNERAGRFGETAANAITSGLIDAAMEPGRFKDFAKQTLLTIERAFMEALIAEPIKNAIEPMLKALMAGLISGGASGGGGAPSALGNIFRGGQLVPFAAGGVVGMPTIFPMRRGWGLMGEAGPEAVMPLARTRDGKLGVKADNGGGVVINMKVVTPNADSFRKSRRQIQRDLQNMMDRN